MWGTFLVISYCCFYCYGVHLTVAPLASDYTWEIGVILALNCLGRSGTQRDFTNKTRFWGLTQKFYFIRKMTFWDIWLRIMSPLLYPWATLPENSLALARGDGQIKGRDLRIFWEGTERQEHIEIEHSEMSARLTKFKVSCWMLIMIMRSRTDADYDITAITKRYFGLAESYIWYIE